jgi:hypothetical protein
VKRLLPVLLTILALGVGCAGDPTKMTPIDKMVQPVTPTTAAPYRAAAAPENDWPNNWSDETVAAFLTSFQGAYRTTSGGYDPPRQWMTCATSAVINRWSPTAADRETTGKVIDEIVSECGKPR